MGRLHECSHTEDELCSIFTDTPRFGEKAKQPIKEGKMMTKVSPKRFKQHSFVCPRLLEVQMNISATLAWCL